MEAWTALNSSSHVEMDTLEYNDKDNEMETEITDCIQDCTCIADYAEGCVADCAQDCMQDRNCAHGCMEDCAEGCMDCRNCDGNSGPERSVQKILDYD